MSEQAAERAKDSRGGAKTLLNAREAAAYLGVHERTVRRAIASGALPALKAGGSYHITAAALERSTTQTAAQIVALSPPADGMTALPVPLTPFVGRRDEAAILCALLQDPTIRLITLTGPGGIGKTRLAIEGATITQDIFPDGVAFVGLAAVDRADLVLSTIAQALDLHEFQGQDFQRRLSVFLRGRRLLLLLDNFEHVLDAAPLIAHLLMDAPGVTVLVTSRAPLHVSGERELPVPPLALPAPGVPLTADAVLASDAGRLFVDRARTVDPALPLDDRQMACVAEICARLDGLPLAIELAAARTRLLPPALLLEQLAPSLPVLTGGPRDLPARQRTLRDAIGWSYDLLPPEAQAFFRRLAPFVGGFTLDAVEAIGYQLSAIGSEPTPDSRAITHHPSPITLNLVNSLIEQSLLVRERGLDGAPRLRLLETIREYGFEQLAAHGEEAAARASHARHFCDLAESLRVPAALTTAQEPLDRLEVEDANLRAALVWLERAGPAEDFVRLATALQGYWLAFSHFLEGREWLERALAKAEAAPPLMRAQILVGLGLFASCQGDQAAAESLFAAGMPMLRAFADPLQTAVALVWFGVVMSHCGDYASAESLLAEALALAETVAEPHWQAAAAGKALSNLGVAVRERGDLEAAARWHEEALARYRAYGHELGVTRALTDLGNLARDQRNYPLAVVRYREVLARVRERGDMRPVVDALSGIASAAAEWGHARAAALLFGAAAALRARVGLAMLLPADLAAEERGMRLLREALGAERAAELLSEGRALTRAEAEAEAATVVAPRGATQEPAIGAPPDHLSSREVEVLRLLVAQRTNREIAAALFLSPRTVSWHVTRILGKLGVRSRREAAALAVAEGLV